MTKKFLSNKILALIPARQGSERIKVKNIIKKCVEFSENSSFPESSSLYENVYDQNYQFIKD